MYIPQTGFQPNPMSLNRYPMGFESQQPLQQVIYSKSKLEHINCILPASEEEGGLYIGDTISTLKPELVANNNIGAILCLNQEAAKNAHLSKARFEYKYIEIQDRADYPIKLHFDSANQFIHKNIKDKKNVLVQCHAGVSRSATIICAYLVKHKNKIPEQAIHMVKSKRERAKPNAGFAQQIEDYWREINNLNKSSEINLTTPTKAKIQRKEEAQQKNRVQTANPETIVRQEKQRTKPQTFSREKQLKSVSLNKSLMRSQEADQSPKKQQYQAQTEKKIRNSIGGLELAQEKSPDRANQLKMPPISPTIYEPIRDQNLMQRPAMMVSSSQPVYHYPMYYNQVQSMDPRVMQQTFIHPSQMHSMGAFPNQNISPNVYPMSQYNNYYPTHRYI